MSALLKHCRLRQIPMLQDGNSFYKAISQAYYKDQDFHLLLRRSLVENIQYNKYYMFLFPTLHHMSQIVHAHKKKHNWHLDLEPIVTTAIAHFLNINLEIYSENEDKTINKKVLTPTITPIQTIRLLQRANQYDLLQKD